MCIGGRRERGTAYPYECTYLCMYSNVYLFTCGKVPVPVTLLVEEAHEEGRRLPVRRVTVVGGL